MVAANVRTPVPTVFDVKILPVAKHLHVNLEREKKL